MLFVITMIDDHNKDFNTIIHFTIIGYALEGFTTVQKKHLIVKAVYYTFIARYLYKMGPNEILRRCVFDHE